MTRQILSNPVGNFFHFLFLRTCFFSGIFHNTRNLLVSNSPRSEFWPNKTIFRGITFYPEAQIGDNISHHLKHTHSHKIFTKVPFPFTSPFFFDFSPPANGNWALVTPGQAVLPMCTLGIISARFHPPLRRHRTQQVEKYWPRKVTPLHMYFFHLFEKGRKKVKAWSFISRSLR